MKIDLIKLEGFRGIKDPLEIPCGPGFTVICGLNGAGKSTICDALEFVLSGSLSLREGTERREDISNYLWWRGDKPAKQHFVEVQFRDSVGNELKLLRTHAVSPSEALMEKLVHIETAPPDWVSELCRTSIIRDEAITALSTDRPERDRYQFALQAMGLADSVGVEERMNVAISILKTLYDAAEKNYEDLRTKVERSTSELSQARIAATKATQEGVERVRKAYSEYLGEVRIGLPDLAGVIARQVAQLRDRVGRLELLREAKRRLDAELSEIQTNAYQERLGELESQITAIEAEMSVRTVEYNTLRQKVEREQENSPLPTSLALLREHGAQVGLQDGRCPLCGSVVSTLDFETHLAEIKEVVSKLNDNLTDAIAAENSARGQLTRTLSQVDNLKRSYRALKLRGDEISMEMNSLAEQARKLNVELNIEALTAEAEKCLSEISSRNEDFAIVEAYATIHRVTEIEEVLKGSRQSAEQSEKELTRIRKSRDLAFETKDAANRVSGEIVRERLAALKPLFIELYERLRPHSGWREVDFLLRGDVMPFLSFVVGDGLNPRFVFSSGQRRALGIAFLLAVHLSRAWCNLDTLVLDDPVQHIDDYRALHLVETLAAFRMNGRQVICSVEDPALADLLCRRLRTNGGSEGVRVDLEFRPSDGVQIKAIRSVEPLPTRVLAAD